jgi:hypothetical protein
MLAHIYNREKNKDFLIEWKSCQLVFCILQISWVFFLLWLKIRSHLIFSLTFYNDFIYLFIKFQINPKNLGEGCGSSVGMIMVQFEDSLRQRSEVQISIRSSYSEEIFYEKKKFNDLWAHFHRIALPTICYLFS